jgi:hypothetical protein
LIYSHIGVVRAYEHVARVRILCKRATSRAIDALLRLNRLLGLTVLESHSLVALGADLCNEIIRKFKCARGNEDIFFVLCIGRHRVNT